MYTLQFAPLFREELADALDYIKHTLQAPQAAHRHKEEVKKTYKFLRTNPFMFPAVPHEELAAQGFRFAMVKNYLIFYKVEGKAVILTRFMHGNRNWMERLGEDN